MGRSVTYREDYRTNAIVRVPTPEEHYPNCHKKRHASNVRLETVYDIGIGKSVWFDRNELVIYKRSFIHEFFKLPIKVKSVVNNDYNRFVEKSGVSWESRVSWESTIEFLAFLPTANVWMLSVNNTVLTKHIWWIVGPDEAMRWFYRADVSPPKNLLEQTKQAMIKHRNESL